MLQVSSQSSDTPAAAESTPSVVESSVPAESTPSVVESSVPAESTPSVVESSVPAESTPSVVESSVPAESTPSVDESSVPIKSTPSVDESSVPIKSTPRSSNLELFRILVMCLIVAHHYVSASGLMLPDGPMYADPFSLNSLWLFLFGAWGKIGINCFVLITGYFMCKSNITLRKFIKLFAQVLFYGVFINGLFLCFDHNNFSFSDFLHSQLPFLRIEDNFVACFLIFFLFIPFLNILIKNLNEKQHIRLTALALFTYSILSFRPIFEVSFNYVSWFMVLYLVSSYIRLYPKKLFENTKKWAVSLAVMIFLSSAAVIASVWLSAHYHRTIAYAYVADSNQILAFVTSLCAFMTFKNLKIKTNIFINAAAATTFGVFLFHSYCAPMRRWLWYDVFANIEAYSHSWLIAHSIFAVAVVFCAGSLFDWLRIRWLERPFMKFYDKLEPDIHAKFKKIENKFVQKNNMLR